MRSIMSRLVAAGVIVVLASAPESKAGGWVFKPGFDGGPHLWEYQHDDSDYSHLSNPAPQIPHPRNVAYSVVLHNNTNLPIAYKLNDQNEPVIKPGESVKWMIYGSKDNPAVFGISFDNTRHHLDSYRLQNFIDYEFRLVGPDKEHRLDLFRLDRKLWRYKTGFWENKGNGNWITKDDAGPHVVNVQEVQVTDEYVELYDPNLDYTLRLTNDALLARGGNNKAPHFDIFTKLYSGRWQR